MATKRGTEMNDVVAIRTALRDEAAARLATVTVQLKAELAIREQELTDAQNGVYLTTTD